MRGSTATNAGPPIIAGGVVWTIDLDVGVLQALDLHTGRLRASLTVGPTGHFASPSVAGGRIYVAAGRTVVAVAGV